MSSPPPEPGRRGVIHDLGYRPYDGQRLAEGFIARSLFVTGLRNAFGLGRSGKSKILPFVLLGLNLVPALVLVVIMVVLRQDDLPTEYAAYAGTTQMMVSVFAASQAPILFSHDLRFGSIVLYLARPLRASTYAVIRWASLVAALLVFLLTPILLLYVGALLADADLTEQTADMLQAVGMALLLAGMVASIAGVISSWSTRRGFAVVATIAVLLLGDGIVTAVQAIAEEQDASGVGEIAGLLSPYRIYRGLVSAWLDVDAGIITPPDSAAAQLAYAAVALLFVVGGLGLLVWRYRKVAGR